MYLVRHGATAANLAQPNFLQGQTLDLDLAPLGVRQALLTSEYLALQPIRAVYCSPMKRAVQTARILAQPRQLPTDIVAELTECHVGRWEGLTWEQIMQQDPEYYNLFQADPAHYGYPGGESFAEVLVRVTNAVHRLLATHAGETILVVSHHIVLRVYLASVLGLEPQLSRRIKLDNCSISCICSENGETYVVTVNSGLHLNGCGC